MTRWRVLNEPSSYRDSRSFKCGIGFGVTRTGHGATFVNVLFLFWSVTFVRDPGVRCDAPKPAETETRNWN